MTARRERVTRWEDLTDEERLLLLRAAEAGAFEREWVEIELTNFDLDAEEALLDKAGEIVGRAISVPDLMDAYVRVGDDEEHEFWNAVSNCHHELPQRPR